MNEPITLTPLSFDKECKVAASIKLTKARMTALLTYFQPLYDTDGLRFAGRPDLNERVRMWMDGDYRMTVEMYRALFAHLFFGEDNLAKASAAWPRTMRAAVSTAVREGFVSLSFLTSLVRENPESWTDRSGFNITLSIDKLKSLFTTGSSNSASYLSIDKVIAPMVAAAILPARVAVVPTYDKLPADEKLVVFNGEADMMTLGGEVYQTMRDHGIYLRSNSIPFAEKDVKSMASIAGMREMFATHPPRQLAYFRTRAIMYTLCVAKAFRPRDDEESMHDMLRRYFTRDFSVMYAQYVNVAMPFFSKLNVSVTEGYTGSFIRDIHHSLVQLSDRTPAQTSGMRWISLEGLVDKVAVRLSSRGNYGLDISELYYSQPHNALADVDISPANALAMFLRPMIYGCYMILAALGIAEVAYRDEAPDPDAPYEHFTYIRLTNLGRYVFGLDKIYRASIADVIQSASAFLDPDNLIIRTNSDAAAATIRKLMGTKVSATRFVVTEAGLLKGVLTEADLKKKINTLRSIVKKNFPPIWQSFFDKVMAHIGAIKVVSGSVFVLYEVNANCEDLRRIIATDTDIRRMVRLVEGGGFIVSKVDESRLRALLAERGYRLPEPVRSYSGYYWR